MTDTAPKCLWLHYARPRPNWYALTTEAQDDLMHRWNEVRSRARIGGAIHDGTYHIRGQHDYETVEIWRFPGSIAAFDHWRALVEARYGEYFAFSNNVGLKEDALPSGSGGFGQP